MSDRPDPPPQPEGEASQAPERRAPAGWWILPVAVLGALGWGLIFWLVF